MGVIFDEILGKLRSDTSSGSGSSGGVDITIVQAASANAYTLSTTYTDGASANLTDYIDSKSGSGGASPYDATFGTGGTYATIAAAIAAGKKTLLAAGNSTEVADITLPTSGSISITIPRGIIANIDTFTFIYGGICDVYINGDGTFKWNTTAGGRLFSNGSYTTSIVDVKNVLLDSSGAGSTAILSDGGIERIKDLRITLADVPYTGFYGAEGSTYDNIIILGGGTSAEKPWLQGNFIASNIFITAIFNKIDCFLGTTVIDGLRFKTASGYSVDLYGSISNVSWITGGGTINIGQRANVDNIRMNGSSVLAYPARYTVTSNIRTETDVYITGNENRITNLYAANKSIDITANNCSLINCFAGDEGGGGAKTITINSGSTNTIVIGCLTDAAISDSGTTSVLANNVVF